MYHLGFHPIRTRCRIGCLGIRCCLCKLESSLKSAWFQISRVHMEHLNHRRRIQSRYRRTIGSFFHRTCCKLRCQSRQQAPSIRLRTHITRCKTTCDRRKRSLHRSPGWIGKMARGSCLSYISDPRGRLVTSLVYRRRFLQHFVEGKQWRRVQLKVKFS